MRLAAGALRWEPNPVFVRELRVRLRGDSGFRLLTLWTLIVVAAFGVALGSAVSLAPQGVTQEWFGEVSRSCSTAIWGAQLVLLTLALPGMLGAGLASERMRRTFVQLILTRLTDHDLAGGKVRAAMAQVGHLLLVSVPVQALALLLGGSSWSLPAKCFAICASWAYAVAALSLWLSSETRYPTRGIVVSYLATLLLCGGVPALDLFAAESQLLPGWRPLAAPYASWTALIATCQPDVFEGNLALAGRWGYAAPPHYWWLTSTVAGLVVGVGLETWTGLRVRLMRELTPELFEDGKADA